MDDQELYDWLKKATPEELLSRWRFAPVGDHIFLGEPGREFGRRLSAVRQELGEKGWSDLSKRVGWNKP